jgi:hypothetical protein
MEVKAIVFAAVTGYSIYAKTARMEGYFLLKITGCVAFMPVKKISKRCFQQLLIYFCGIHIIENNSYRKNGNDFFTFQRIPDSGKSKTYI